jgi:hypothetical protein
MHVYRYPNGGFYTEIIASLRCSCPPGSKSVGATITILSSDETAKARSGSYYGLILLPKQPSTFNGGSVHILCQCKDCSGNVSDTGSVQLHSRNRTVYLFDGTETFMTEPDVRIFTRATPET